MLAALNVAFFVLHGALVVFNVVGWAWRKTRRLNVLTLLLTLFSWIVMGIWYRVGYCVLTDLHWRVREAMGIHEASSSYLALLTRTFTGWEPPAALVNPAAATGFVAALTISISLNIRDARAKRCGDSQLSIPVLRLNESRREDEG